MHKMRGEVASVSQKQAMRINDYTMPEAHLPQRSSKGHFSKYTVNVACKNCSGSFMGFFSVFC